MASKKPHMVSCLHICSVVAVIIIYKYSCFTAETCKLINMIKPCLLKATKYTQLVSICQQSSKLRDFLGDNWCDNTRLVKGIKEADHIQNNQTNSGIIDKKCGIFFSASIVLICRRTGVLSSSKRSSCLPSKKQRDLDKSDRGDLPYSVELISFL